MLRFQHELIEVTYREMEDLTPLHYAHAATHHHIKQLNPDWERFIEMERQELCRMVTARSDGQLVGYFISFIIPHIHFKGCTMAINDAVFMHPDYRGIGSYRLFKAAIKDLKQHTDADILNVHMKIHLPFRKLLTKLGFIQTEESWELVL